MNSKPKIIKDYDKLKPETLDHIKLTYPHGFEKHLISFKNRENKFVSALPFESDDYYYLVRMTKAEAQEIIEDDEDFDEDGNLKDEVKLDIEERIED